MVAAAEREGLLDVDLVTGKVVARTASFARRAAAGGDDSA
jgi:hypothetical protein